ncbi:hypothetical protein C8Q77DRAFT_139927 [Trametes polyzona]|nr:hypothetical protein C8Q77DRAFT_139927 [Trametes polyzona]
MTHWPSIGRPTSQGSRTKDRKWRRRVCTMRGVQLYLMNESPPFKELRPPPLMTGSETCTQGSSSTRNRCSTATRSMQNECKIMSLYWKASTSSLGKRPRRGV